MLDKWTGEIVGIMHNEEITYQELADHLGVKKSYISMILHCKRCPNGVENRIRNAIMEIIYERKKV